jgi:hypothetical protein
VWQPKSGGQEKDVSEATATFPDKRARHFWDGSGWTVEHFKSVLGIQVDAWDLYLLYDADARWDGDEPPKPLFWMHQLRGVDNGPLLDAGVFGDHIASALGGVPN